MNCNINGKCELEINPSDPVFVQKLSAAIIRLDSLQSQCRKVKCRTPGAIKKLMAIDKEMCLALDSTFGVAVSKALGITHTVSAQSVDGPPVWFNVVSSVVDQLSVVPTKAAAKIIKQYRKRVMKNDER